MGEDKASKSIDGQPAATKIASELVKLCYPVTILGTGPLAGYAFLADTEQHSGPLRALSHFEPRCPMVFVASCDMPRFAKEVVEELMQKIHSKVAAIPTLQGVLQPLCALYSAAVWPTMREMVDSGEARMMAFARRLDALEIPFDNSPLSVQIRSANTPDEWNDLKRS